MKARTPSIYVQFVCFSSLEDVWRYRHQYYENLMPFLDSSYVFEPNCAPAWSVGSCAFCLSVRLCKKLGKHSLGKKYEKKNPISATVKLRVMRFGQNIDVDDPKNEHESQRSRSPGQKTLFQVSLDHLTGNL